MKAGKVDTSFLFMAVVFWFFWIVVTASLHLQELLTGAAIALLLTWFNGELFFRRDERALFDARTLLLYLRYTMHLIIAIIQANIQVALIVLNPRMPISPGMIRFSRPFKKNLNKVILANSITLTPGTLTVLLEGDDFVVHALTRENAREVAQWKLAEELAGVEELQEAENIGPGD